MKYNEIPKPEDDDGLQFFEPISDVWDHIDIAMVRDRPLWVNYNDTPVGYDIQLGAGRKMIVNWDNIEYPAWDAEAPADSPRWRIPYDDGTVANIACYHTLDHLRPESVVRALQEFQRVLADGGVATIVVPHYMSQLANECIMHRSRFAIDTWRNIFSERQYDHSAEGNGEPWHLDVGANFIYGITERNLVLVTQLIRDPR